MVMYEKQPILDKFKTVLNFSRHISYSIKTLFRGLLSSSDSGVSQVRANHNYVIAHRCDLIHHFMCVRTVYVLIQAMAKHYIEVFSLYKHMLLHISGTTNHIPAVYYKYRYRHETRPLSSYKGLATPD